MEKIEINLKKVAPVDLDELREISRETFYETFSSGNTEDNMKLFLDEAFSKEKLTSELLNTNSDFYFAQIDRTSVGYLKLNFGSAQTELHDDSAIEIERIYVIKEFIGKNVGKFLFCKTIEIGQKKRLITFGWEFGKKIHVR